MVSRIVRHLPEIDNKYFDERKDKPAGEKTTGLIVVTADKGLAGAYNHNVLKMAEEQMQKAGQTGSYKLFVVGELGRQYFGHRGIKVAEQFHYTAQNPTLHRARTVSYTHLMIILKIPRQMRSTRPVWSMRRRSASAAGRTNLLL